MERGYHGGRGVLHGGRWSPWKWVCMEVAYMEGSLHGGVCLWRGFAWKGSAWREVCMEGGMHGGADPAPLSKYSQVALGMHPTVMNSFFHNFLERSFA